MRYHPAPLEWLLSKVQKITNVGEDVEKLDLLCTVDGNIKWYNGCGTMWELLKKLNIDLPYDLAIPVLGTQAKKKKLKTGS